MGNVWSKRKEERGDRDTIDSQSQWNLHLEELDVIAPVDSKLRPPLIPSSTIWTTPSWISIEKQFVLCQRESVEPTGFVWYPPDDPRMEIQSRREGAEGREWG